MYMLDCFITKDGGGMSFFLGEAKTFSPFVNPCSAVPVYNFQYDDAIFKYNEYRDILVYFFNSFCNNNRWEVGHILNSYIIGGEPSPFLTKSFKSR